MTKETIRVFGANFTGYAKSASLREENASVEPTYFDWMPEHGFTTLIPPRIWYVDGAIGKRASVPNIAWLLEPRCLHPENYENAKKYHDHYDYVLSYDKEFLEEIPNGLYYPFGGSSIAFDKWGIYPKTKNIAMFYSGKDTTEGHKLRKQIVEQFGDRIDVYGAGVGKPVDTKFEVLKDYAFCVIIESCFIEGYFSEKLIDACSVGTIPIYKGDPNITDMGFSVVPFHNLESLLQRTPLSDYRHYSHIMDNFGDNSVLKDHETAKQYRCVEDWLYTHLPELFE